MTVEFQIRYYGEDCNAPELWLLVERFDTYDEAYSFLKEEIKRDCYTKGKAWLEIHKVFYNKDYWL